MLRDSLKEIQQPGSTFPWNPNTISNSFTPFAFTSCTSNGTTINTAGISETTRSSPVHPDYPIMHCTGLSKEQTETAESSAEPNTRTHRWWISTYRGMRKGKSNLPVSSTCCASTVCKKWNARNVSGFQSGWTSDTVAWHVCCARLPVIAYCKMCILQYPWRCF